MRFTVILCFLLTAHSLVIVAQDSFRVMFYNVENLFDTQDDPKKEDDDFLPDGFMRWTPWKYWEKQRNITRVITAVGGMQSPALVGLCEIENDSVLFDLTKRSPLKAQEYEFIISDSPDERGIDVALLYQRHQFKPIGTCEYEIKFNRKNTRPTRDTLDLFICHFPSRSDGQRETEPARMEAASLLKAKTDSLFLLRENARIIIMGDFNDHPGNKSLSRVLEARSMEPGICTGPTISTDRLYNLLRHREKEPDTGTYKYQGKWEILDQFIVSGNLLMEGNGVQVKDNEAHIFNAAFLLEGDAKYYGEKPFRTSSGPRYLGGFSDHLPIYMDLVLIFADP